MKEGKEDPRSCETEEAGYLVLFPLIEAPYQRAIINGTRS
jgi:hypothetical protein